MERGRRETGKNGKREGGREGVEVFSSEGQSPPLHLHHNRDVTNWMGGGRGDEGLWIDGWKEGGTGLRSDG